MNRVKGKTVLITGASAGIGEACARHFAANGANLIIAARRVDRLKSIEQALTSEHNVSVRARELDVRNRKDVAAFGKELAATGLAVDILVNNAGLASGLSKLHEGDYEDWDRMIDTNVKGLLNVSREIIPQMVERNSGHIINIGSIAGHIVYPQGNVYNATKFAVKAINEGMNIDLVGTNIRVSSVDPGMADTEFSVVRFKGDEGRAAAVYKGFDALTGDDVAEAVLFVANTPQHVSVVDLVIMPTAQRSPYVVHRD